MYYSAIPRSSAKGYSPILVGFNPYRFELALAHSQSHSHLHSQSRLAFDPRTSATPPCHPQTTHRSSQQVGTPSNVSLVSHFPKGIAKHVGIFFLHHLGRFNFSSIFPHDPHVLHSYQLYTSPYIKGMSFICFLLIKLKS